MNRTVILLFITVLFVFTSACKKEDAKQNSIQSVGKEAETDEKAVIQPSNGKYPEITFEKSVHDFGTIKQGDKVTYDFKFKNTGQADLIITDAKGSCGCTVPEYPKNPIKPEENGTIKVTFDSSGKSGLNTKSVVLTCNTKDPSKIITIKTNIEASIATK